MPGMTMAFKVKDAGVMAGKTAGDLVRAHARRRGHARVSDEGRRHGHAPLTEPPPIPVGDRRVASGPAGAGRTPRRSGRNRAAPVGLARTRAGRHVHIHALSAAGLLPADGSPVRRRPARGRRRTRSCGDRVHLLSVTLDPAFDTPPVLLDARAAASAPTRRPGLSPPANADGSGAVRVTVRRLGDARRSVRRRRSSTTCGRRSSIATARLTTIFDGNDWSAGRPR